jgi:hypothetical protein
MPLLVALLIVVASGALAVWTLRRSPLTFSTPVETRSTREPEAPRPTPPLALVATQPTRAPTAPPGPRGAATRTPAPLRSRPLVAAAPIALATMPPRLAPSSTLAAVPAREATPVPALRRPAVVTHVSPRRIKRGSHTLLDIHGRELRGDHLATVFRSGKRSGDVTVGRQKLVGPTLLQAVVAVGAKAAKGSYDVVVIDAQDRQSNAVHFEVTQ